MAEDYRGNLSRMLPERLKTAGLEPGAKVSEFMAAVANGTILGVSVPEEVTKYLCRYAVANIQMGKKLEEFTIKETAILPDSFFDQVLNPDPNKERPTVSDAMYAVRIAIDRFGLTANGGNNCSHLAELPLAA